MSDIKVNNRGKHFRDQWTLQLNDIEKGFYRLKKETLRQFFKRVKANAISNIETNRQQTNTPYTGRLERSIRLNERGRTITVGGPEAPYANMLNQAEGAKTIIVANNRLLVFFNHRTNEWNRKPYVLIPGYAFFTRAWTTALADVPEIVENLVEIEFKTNRPS